MSGCSSQTSSTRILNLLKKKKSKHITLQIAVLHPAFVIIQPFALGYASTLPLLIHTPRSLQAGVPSVQWSKNSTGELCLTPSFTPIWTQPGMRHIPESVLHVSAAQWRHSPPCAHSLESTSEWFQVFSKSEWLHLMNS